MLAFRETETKNKLFLNLPPFFLGINGNGKSTRPALSYIDVLLHSTVNYIFFFFLWQTS
jgi:hypothetical protein